jgi:hypothetical protein
MCDNKINTGVFCDGSGDEDVDDFSGSIASSSVSVLAFGASFLLGWAQLFDTRTN